MLSKQRNAYVVPDISFVDIVARTNKERKLFLLIRFNVLEEDFSLQRIFDNEEDYREKIVAMMEERESCHSPKLIEDITDALNKRMYIFDKHHEGGYCCLVVT